MKLVMVTMLRTRWTIHLLGVLLAHAPAWASPLAMEGKLVEVIARTVEPEARRGRLSSLDLDQGLTLEADGREHRTAATDLVRVISLHHESPSRPQRDAQLKLSGGDVLFGQVVDGAADALIFEARELGRISVPLEAVVSLSLAPSQTFAHAESADGFTRSEDAEEDHLLLTNGDVLRGFVTALDGDGVSMDGALGKTKIALRNLTAVRMAAQEPPALAQPYARVRLRSGARLTATRFDWKRNEVTMVMRQGPAITVEADRVVEVEFVGGRWEWLAAQHPISYEHTPMLATAWDWVSDRNVLGGELTVAGETYSSGVGVHSRARLVYDLQGKYRELVTSFGLDDDSGPLADVAVSILLDGHRAHSAANVRRGKLYGPLRLDVARVNRLELLVDFGENGDLQDRFNWIETAVIRD